MKSSKIVLIALLLLLCATAKAQGPVSSDPQVIPYSAGYLYYDPTHPEYSGNLSASYSFTEEMNLGFGYFLIKCRFYGGNNSAYYSLHVKTSNIGEHTFDFIDGEYELNLLDPGTVRLSLLYATETANCNWQIYRYYYVVTT